MRIGSVMAPGLVVKLAMTRSSSESVKASIQPEATAGLISGSVTVRKVRSGGERAEQRGARGRGNADAQRDAGGFQHRAVGKQHAIPAGRPPAPDGDEPR